MPPEVHQYYQGEHRERVGVAWLLAFATLVITVGIALGGYFGGRAIYRKVAKKNKSSTTSQVATENKSNSAAQTSATPSNSSTKSGQISNQAATTVTPTSPPPKTTATLNSQLPHTGPEGDD